MNGLDYSAEGIASGIGTPSEESFVSSTDISYPQFQLVHVSSQDSVEDGFGSLSVSALPAHQTPGLFDWTFMQNAPVNQFPAPRINSDEQQNAEQFGSETWLSWTLGRDGSSVGMEYTSPDWSLENLPLESPCSLNLLQDHEDILPVQTMTVHGAVHGPLLTDVANQCNECSIAFPTKAAVYRHSKDSNHLPHPCLCGKRFSRLDVLDRHVMSLLSPEITYACPHCKKYRGPRAFRRRDHLTQHLRGYHHIDLSSESEDSAPQKSQRSIPPPRRKKEKLLRCARPGCSNSDTAKTSMSAAFQTQSQLTQHMRDFHDESLFPCQETRCSRIGGKGFFRRRDLMKHMKEHH